MREAQGQELETNVSEGEGTLSLVQDTYAYTHLYPIHSWIMPSSTLALELLGPLSNWEVGGWESWPHAPQD